MTIQNGTFCMLKKSKIEEVKFRCLSRYFVVLKIENFPLKSFVKRIKETKKKSFAIDLYDGNLDFCLLFC